LYGTTNLGGRFLLYGALFKLTPQQDGIWTETIVKSFNNDVNGCFPRGLVSDQQDNLYGIATNCGQSFGTVWEFSQAGVFSLIQSFNSLNGEFPHVGLAIDNAGNLYGAAGGGNPNFCGSGCGLLFEMARSSTGWQERILYEFMGTPGAGPNGDLAFDAEGNLYGTTEFNWPIDYGTLFELRHTPEGVFFNTIAVFTQAQGSPYAGVVFDSQGNAYGTQSAGNAGYGAIYELIP
jgi:hypothetical protein